MAEARVLPCRNFGDLLRYCELWSGPSSLRNWTRAHDQSLRAASALIPRRRPISSNSNFSR